MRARFIAPGLALAGFAATLAIVAWPHYWPDLERDQRHTALQPQAAPPAVQARPATPAAPPVAATTPARPVQDAAAQTDDAAAGGSQPPLPDPATLPSYQEDQAERNANALRSARTR